jgi:hypothetical protein
VLERVVGDDVVDRLGVVRELLGAARPEVAADPPRLREPAGDARVLREDVDAPSGNITLSNSIRAGGTNNVCYSYLGATTATPAPCVNNGTLTVTNPVGGATMSVIVATTGRARIQ